MVILKSSFAYRSERPSCFMCSSIAYALTGLVEYCGTLAVRQSGFVLLVDAAREA